MLDLIVVKKIKIVLKAEYFLIRSIFGLKKNKIQLTTKYRIARLTNFAFNGLALLTSAIWIIKALKLIFTNFHYFGSAFH